MFKRPLKSTQKIQKPLQGEGNLIFYCMGPTDPTFWQIKIIMILISHINIFFTICIFF